MRKKYYFLNVVACILLVIFQAKGQWPAQFESRGTGGGGAFFSPSVNPANESEYFVASDMSELFQTEDYGQSYKVCDFRNIQAGHNTKMVFTSNANLRYTIDYSNNQAVPVKSIDGGETWTMLAGNPDASAETFGIYADYNNPGRVIISYFGSVYFSSDGGNSFADIHDAINMGAGILVGGVFFDGQQIYIGTNDGLLVSADGGATFSIDSSTGIQPGQEIFSFAGAKQGGTTRFFILTADVNDIYVGVMGWDYWGFIRGVYSMDYGSNTWVNRLPGIITSQDYLMYVAMAENDTGTVYLAGATYLGEPNVMRWRSSTNQWQHVFQTAVNQNIYTGWSGSGGDHGWSFPECFFGIAVAKFNSSKVIVTDYSCVHKTSDGGVTWQQAYVSANDEHPAGASTTPHQNYHSAGIENISCWQVFWNDPANLFGACSDVTAIRSDDGGASWSYNYSGITSNTVYRMAKNISNSTLYAATSSIHDIYQSTRLQDAVLDAANANGKVLFSADNGASWQTLHDFGHPVYWIAMDPGNANRMYVSVVNHSANAGGIYVSANINLGASSTWTRIPPPGRTEGHPGNIQVLYDGTVLCSWNGRRNSAGAFTQSSGVFIYNPGLQQWSDKSDQHMFYWTQDVVVDPNDATQNTWYAGVYNGWGGPPNGLGGLYKTTDRGSTWTRLLTLEGVTSVTFNPSDPDQLLVATEANGLLTSTDINSQSPSFLDVTTYPFRQPHRIFFNPYNANEIWVSSFGNGIRVGDMTSTGIGKDSKADDKLSVFPNPANHRMTIGLRDVTCSMDGNMDIQIFSTTGEKLLSSSTQATPCLMQQDINTEDLPQGVYVIQVILDGYSRYQRIFIKE